MPLEGEPRKLSERERILLAYLALRLRATRAEKKRSALLGMARSLYGLRFSSLVTTMEERDALAKAEALIEEVARSIHKVAAEAHAGSLHSLGALQDAPLLDELLKTIETAGK